MRAAITLCTAVFLIGATDIELAQEGASSLPLDSPAYEEPAAAWTKMPDIETVELERCADRIREARATANLPELDRRPASADKPIMIWAVDHRRDGCGVLVAKGNPEDIRPVPESDGTYEMMPAKAEQPKQDQ